MSARLFPAGGASSIVLTKRCMLMGRAEGCDIRLSHAVVSNKHCQLVYDGGNWLLQDLGSRNGTMVNGVPVTKDVRLKSGDTIIVAAKFKFVVEYDIVAERQRFAAEDDEGPPVLGDDRNYLEHGPGTKRLEPHDKDIWS